MIFTKTYGYACLYKSETGDVDQIPATELTITFVCYHYPVKMLQRLEYDKKMSIKNIENGIYYLIGDSIPIQLIIIPKLSKENNYWLNNLRNDLKSGGEIRNFIEQYGRKKNKIISGTCRYNYACQLERIKGGKANVSSITGIICG